jgi:hypothetical protein
VENKRKEKSIPQFGQARQNMPGSPVGSSQDDPELVCEGLSETEQGRKKRTRQMKGE